MSALILLVKTHTHAWLVLRLLALRVGVSWHNLGRLLLLEGLLRMVMLLILIMWRVLHLVFSPVLLLLVEIPLWGLLILLILLLLVALCL